MTQIPTDLELHVHSEWPQLVLAAVVMFGGAAAFAFVGLDYLRTPLNLVLAASLAVQGVRTLRLSLYRPRLTLGPRGLTDHTASRGLMLWSDFTDVSTSGPTFLRWRTPKLSLHATEDVCWHYNQRLPWWRRLLRSRWLGGRVIDINALALEYEREWLEAEMHRRIQLRAPRH